MARARRQVVSNQNIDDTVDALHAPAIKNTLSEPLDTVVPIRESLLLAPGARAGERIVL